MRPIPTETDVIGWFESLTNWGRWGDDDMLGTLNLVTPEKRRQAARCVREGIAVSCSRTITYDLAADVSQPSRHFMLASGEEAPREDSYGRTGVMDVFLIAPHGLTITHLDAPSHTLWRSRPEGPLTMYNGHAAAAVRTRDGATVGSIEVAGEGIVTRGVLLDLVAVRGREWVEPGTALFPEDLEAAERAQGIEVGPGDALLVRTGHVKRRNRLGPVDPPSRWAGLHAACLPWIRQRDIALLAGDTAQDVSPHDYPNIGYPIHGVGMAGLGLWLLDNLDPEALFEQCRRLGRWEFMLSIGPLRLQHATGSPVNPIALL